MFKIKINILFIVLFLATTLIIASRLIILLNSGYTFYSDDAVYASLAKALSRGQFAYFFHPTWPPLFPAVSALIHFIIPTWELSLRSISFISASILLIPFYFLVKESLTKFHAFLFCLSLLMFVPLMDVTFIALSDALFIFLITSAVVLIFLALFSQKHIERNLMASSLIFGLSFLTRSEGLMFFSLTVIFLLGYWIFQYSSNKKIISRKLRTILICAAIFLAVISPYTIALRIQLGEWTLSQKFSAQMQQGQVFELRSNGKTWAQEVASAKFPNYKSPYFKNGASIMLNRFYIYLNSFNRKLLHWEKIYLSIFPLWFWPLTVIGLFGAIRKKMFIPLIYLFSIMCISIPVIIFSTPTFDIRYLLWSFPFLLYLFYLGFYNIFLYFPRFAKIAALVPFLTTLLLPSMSLKNITEPYQYADKLTSIHENKEIIEVSDWIKENIPHKNLKIMMRHEGVEFYTEGETIYMPQVSLPKLLDYAKINNVDYILAWDLELANDENLNILMDNETIIPELNKIYSSERGKSKIIIYELL